MLASAKQHATLVFKALQFLKRLARHQHPIRFLTARQLVFNQGQSVTIGRYQFETVVIELEQGTVELKPGLLGRNGEDDSTYSLLQEIEGYGQLFIN